MTETLTRAEGKALLAKKPKRSKYGNQPCTLDGHRFDSKAERDHYAILKQLEMAGEIFDIELQRKFPLSIGGFLICTYISDFCFTSRKDGQFHVIDVKGVRTKEFRIKAKLMRALLGIVVEEVRA